MAVYEVDSMEGIPSNLKEFVAKFDVVEKFEERDLHADKCETAGLFQKT